MFDTMCNSPCCLDIARVPFCVWNGALKKTGVRRKRLDANLGKRRCTTPWPREWLGKRGPASHGAHAASDGMVSVFKFVCRLFQIIIVTVAQSFTT